MEKGGGGFFQEEPGKGLVFQGQGRVGGAGGVEIRDPLTGRVQVVQKTMQQALTAAGTPAGRTEFGQPTYGGVPVSQIVGGTPLSTTDWLKQKTEGLRAQFEEEKKQRRAAAGAVAPARRAVTIFQGAERR